MPWPLFAYRTFHQCRKTHYMFNLVITCMSRRTESSYCRAMCMLELLMLKRHKKLYSVCSWWWLYCLRHWWSYSQYVQWLVLGLRTFAFLNFFKLFNFCIVFMYPVYDFMMIIIIIIIIITRTVTCSVDWVLSPQIYATSSILSHRPHPHNYHTCNISLILTSSDRSLSLSQYRTCLLVSL